MPAQQPAGGVEDDVVALAQRRDALLHRRLDARHRRLPVLRDGRDSQRPHAAHQPADARQVHRVLVGKGPRLKILQQRGGEDDRVNQRRVGGQKKNPPRPRPANLPQPARDNAIPQPQQRQHDDAKQLIEHSTSHSLTGYPAQTVRGGRKFRQVPGVIHRAAIRPAPKGSQPLATGEAQAEPVEPCRNNARAPTGRQQKRPSPLGFRSTMVKTQPHTTTPAPVPPPPSRQSKSRKSRFIQTPASTSVQNRKPAVRSLCRFPLPARMAAGGGVSAGRDALTAGCPPPSHQLNGNQRIFWTDMTRWASIRIHAMLLPVP
ncbi:MAG: hypothetical protein BWY76_00684 [bacterium ADurb.Bin429]|nr:MAG: hypothetical protein BWY76_00684 [bacterium ADurb.Bin429]